MARAVNTRRYESPVRQEQAAQTRARIVEGAATLFEERGYGRTTVRQVAEAAGVAVDTVYAIFGQKPRLLTAVIDLRLSAGTGVGNVMERPEALAVRDEPDQRRQIQLLAADLAGVVERVGPVFEMLRTAGSVEPAMAEVYAEMQGYRARNMRTAIDWIAARGPLRVNPEQAASTLWAVAAPDTHRLLVGTGGWSRDDYAAWLADVLTRALLD
jgi:AcrR family transcriptional regulator